MDLGILAEQIMEQQDSKMKAKNIENGKVEYYYFNTDTALVVHFVDYKVVKLEIY